jgi:succinyl-diaminopimelate desuccinylase
MTQPSLRADGSSLARRTCELCAIPSVTGAEAELAGTIVALLHGLDGLAVERRGNCVIGLARARRSAIDGASKGSESVASGPDAPVQVARPPLITLLGHLDTVPPSVPNPVRTADGRIHGLGASDMKSGIAVMIELALGLFRPGGAGLACDLGLVFYDREEGPFHENGLEKLLAEVDWLRRTDLAIVLEPSDGAVQVGCLGSLQCRVTFTGRSAHSARPWEGENALHKAGPLLVRLAAMSPRDVSTLGLLFRESMSATTASGGRANNVIPDRFELNLNFRFAPGRTVAEAEQEVRELVGNAAIVEFRDVAPAGVVRLDHPLVARFLRLTGAPVEPKQAWTDVARLSSEGIVAFNFGPGIVGQCHQAGEYALVSDLVSCFDRLARFLEGL